MIESKNKEKEAKDTKESLSEEDEIIRIHCAENDDGCKYIIKTQSYEQQT